MSSHKFETASDESTALYASMRAARDAEAATVDRTAQLYDHALRWAICLEDEAATAGVPLQDYLVCGSRADHMLWLVVDAHRNRYPASAGPRSVSETASLHTDPLHSRRPWAPVGAVLSRLGSAAETLARLADRTDCGVDGFFFAGPVAHVEALAYRDALRVGLASLGGGVRISRRTYQILEDLAACRHVHDPVLGKATYVLLDQLKNCLVGSTDEAV